MSASIRWLEDAPASSEAQAAVEAWLRGAREASVLRDNPRRALVRLTGAGGDLLVKRFRAGSGRHARREWWKARLGRSPAARELAGLRRLHERGIPVPEPLALGELDDGDRLLVMRYVEGTPLAEALGRPGTRPGQLLADLGRVLHGLYEAGLIHGDLHPGNVLATPAGPVLLDLQHARRSRSENARIADLGHLDYGLWPYAGTTARVRLHAAALGLARPFEGPARGLLRDVADAAERRAFDHGRSRTRRALRPGRGYAAVRVGAASGMRVRDFDEAAVAEALQMHEAALSAGGDDVLARSARARITRGVAGGWPVVVKQVPPRGLARRIADRVRGTPARRGWLAGHGLLARGVGAARPLAFLESRALGLAGSSVLVIEDLGTGRDALAICEADPESTVRALGALLDALHRRHVHHGDLKATHVFLPESGRPCLIDLEGVRFPRFLDDGARLVALAQLNASLPDTVPNALRLGAFDRYARRHPFADGRPAALREVVARSLAREHRWTGPGCDASQGND